MFGSVLILKSIIHKTSVVLTCRTWRWCRYCIKSRWEIYKFDLNIWVWNVEVPCHCVQKDLTGVLNSSFHLVGELYRVLALVHHGSKVLSDHLPLHLQRMEVRVIGLKSFMSLAWGFFGSMDDGCLLPCPGEKAGCQELLEKLSYHMAQLDRTLPLHKALEPIWSWGFLWM